MRRSIRNSKKQTRLAFGPLSSSSPAKQNYSPAVQDRLASVSYHGARKGLRSKTAATPNSAGAPPTPEPSSTIRGTELVPTSPLTSLPTSPSLPPCFSRARKNASATGDENDDNNDDEDDDDEILPPSSKRRRLNTGTMTDADFGLNQKSEGSFTSQQSSPLSRRQRLSRVSTARRGHRQNIEPNEAQSTQRSDVDGQSGSSSLELNDLGSPETTGDEIDAIVTRPPTARRSLRSKQIDDFAAPDESGSNMELSSKNDRRVARQNRTSSKAHRTVGKAALDDFLVEDDEVEYITSEEDDRVASHETHSSKKSPKAYRRRLQREKEELEDDLLDLQDSDQEVTTRESRTRGGPITTQKDEARKHFALLKEKRAQRGARRVIDSEDEEQPRHIDLESSDFDSTDEVDINDIDKDENRWSSFADASLPLIGAPDHNADIDADAHLVNHQQAFDAADEADEDDEDFIVDDTEAMETGRNGGPHNVDIPLEFTSFASAKPKELFVHIVEWMVKNKISPAFRRDDPVYNLSFTRVDDQVKAQAGSHLISAAWNATFKHTLLARPYMTVESLPGPDKDLIRTCDACNRTNHPAGYDFQFSGPPYDPKTLELLEDEEEEDDADDADGDGDKQSTTSKQTYDIHGHPLSRTAHHFYLGRYCAAAAETSHKLTHWRHHLSTTILDHLESQNVLTPSAIVARDRLSNKKRERQAEAIVDAMQETGVVRALWQDFQDDLEDGKWGMEGFEGPTKKSDRGGGNARSKKRVGSVRIVSSAADNDGSTHSKDAFGIGKGFRQWLDGRDV